MTADTLERRRVQVWFGKTAIADHTAEVELAAKYETAMRRRFAGLRVTNEPVLTEESPATT